MYESRTVRRKRVCNKRCGLMAEKNVMQHSVESKAWGEGKLMTAILFKLRTNRCRVHFGKDLLAMVKDKKCTKSEN